MTIVYGFGNRATIASQTLTQMRSELDRLQLQLATGRRADTYAGLGIGRGLDLSARARLSALEAYQSAIVTVDVRVKLMSTALERLRQIGVDSRSETSMPLTYELVGGGQTQAQQLTAMRLDEALSLLNERAGEHYLFSGRATDKPPVVTAKLVLDGDGARAGLRQHMAERLQADQGADGRGRLLAPAVAGAVVTLAEDAAHPFGFKLAVATTDFGATITPNAGPPADIAIDFGAVNPPEDARVSVRLTLPDGTNVEIALRASSANPPPADGFQIGVNADATAQNFASALDARIQALARTELAAASAMQAGKEFFEFDAANPPQRVDGPPFNTATALRNATPADTVYWYTGDAAADNARQTALARVDDTITVAYGARANEQGIRVIVQNMAVFAAMTFSPADADGRDRYMALAGRVGGALFQPADQQRIDTIQTEIAGANVAAGAAKERLAERKTMLLGVIDEIERISPEEVGFLMLTLNTRMQATMQTTAMLSRFTLLDFM